MTSRPGAGRRGVVAVIALALALAACGTPERAGSGAPPPVTIVKPTASAQPPARAMIDWVSFIRFGGTTYGENRYAASGKLGRALTERDLGPEFARVAFKLSDNVTERGYRPKDGDAAFLEAGTPVHTVVGYRPEFRLAARQGDRVLLFEADTNPAARQGADLLDLGNKVRAIGVNSERDGVTELAAITDPARVADLVEGILRAPVNHDWAALDPAHRGTRYFLAFHLADGTAVSRAYWPDSGELSRGIMTPPAVRTAVEGALRSAAPTPTSAIRAGQAVDLVAYLGLDRAQSVTLKASPLPPGQGTITDAERVGAIVRALAGPRVIAAEAVNAPGARDWHDIVIVGFTLADGRPVVLEYDRTAGDLTSRGNPERVFTVPAPPDFARTLGLE